MTAPNALIETLKAVLRVYLRDDNERQFDESAEVSRSDVAKKAEAKYAGWMLAAIGFFIVFGAALGLALRGGAKGWEISVTCGVVGLLLAAFGFYFIRLRTH